MNHLPNQPPTPALNYPHNPTYQSAQLKPNPPHQPMPYNLLATLSKKNTTDSEWFNRNQTNKWNEWNPTSHTIRTKYLTTHSILYQFYTMTIETLGTMWLSIHCQKTISSNHISFIQIDIFHTNWQIQLQRIIPFFSKYWLPNTSYIFTNWN